MSGEHVRCAWCDPGSEEYLHYHDSEWGVPVAEDRKLYEMLVLEGMQAGLSWLTVLKKREHFRQAFDHFDPLEVSRYGPEKKAELMDNGNIIRNRLKIEAAVANARVVLELQREYGSFADYLWRWVDYLPVQNSFARHEELPSRTPLSERMSKELKKRGMNFVGPTIIYAFMQAVGMVNDHLTSCFRYEQCRRLGRKPVRCAQ